MLTDRTVEFLRFLCPNYDPNTLHIQQVMDILIANDFFLTLVEFAPQVRHFETKVTEDVYTDERVKIDRFRRYLAGHKAIIILGTHAVAWNGTYVYDPSKGIKLIEEYPVASFREAWIQFHSI
jgi:hypothetical protein